MALALKFLLELCAFAALAYWGSRTGPVAVNVILGIGAPLLAAIVWGRYAAPRSPRRLTGVARQALELTILLGSAALLAVAGQPLLAAIFAVVIVANAVMLRELI